MIDYDMIAKEATEYKKLLVQKKQIVERLNVLKRKMTNYLPYKETIKLAGLKIRKTTYYNSRFNVAFFKGDHPKLAEKYTQKTPYLKIVIEEVKDKK